MARRLCLPLPFPFGVRMTCGGITKLQFGSSAKRSKSALVAEEVPEGGESLQSCAPTGSTLSLPDGMGTVGTGD